MTVSASASAFQTTSPVTFKSESSRTTLAGDLSQFLTLLTTQLKYQDPLSPMDSTEFTAQLAQFASVEQGIQTNANLESLIGLTKATQISTGVSYIGRTIEADTNVGALVDGRAEFLYSLPKAASTAVITIRDSDGKIVYTGMAEKSPGPHNFVWNGKDTNGNQLPDGVYVMSVAAASSNDEPISVATHMLGRVDGVVTADNSINVLVGGVAIPLDKILSVKETPASSST